MVNALAAVFVLRLRDLLQRVTRYITRWLRPPLQLRRTAVVLLTVLLPLGCLFAVQNNASWATGILPSVRATAFSAPVTRQGFTSARSASSPHGPYGPTADGCAACHRDHSGSASKLLTQSASDGALCRSCHNGTQARAVSTHSNQANSGFTKQQPDFRRECIDCHNPHGTVNLKLVRTAIEIGRAHV